MGMELIFEVRDAEEGGYFARALGHGIFTEGDTWEELRVNVLEAISVHFEDGPLHPRLVQLHYVKGELIALTITPAPRPCPTPDSSSHPSA
jgi:predicted RNase H-like HicB family nuclease